MAIDVYVQRHGGDRHVPVGIWEELGGLAGNRYQFNEQKWQDCAGELQARQHHAGLPPWVFLRLRDRHLAGQYDREYLRELLQIAGDYSWGAELYLLVDDTIGREPRGIALRQRASLFHWLETAAAGGVTDLLETRFSRYNNTAPNFSQLQGLADDAQERVEVLHEMLRAGHPWRYFIPRKDSLSDLLEEHFSATALPELATAPGVVTVFHRFPSVSDLAEAVQHTPQARHLVALCNPVEGEDKHLRELRDFCGRQPARLKCLEFSGPFELLYFLVRLERGWLAEQRTENHLAKAGQQVGQIEAVRLNAELVFNQNSPKPVILLMNAFDQGADSWEAARDVRRIKQHAPPGTAFFVRPALESHKLPELLVPILQQHTGLTVCYYLGHGDHQAGLQSGPGQRKEAAELWLARFQGTYRGSLPLIFFAACESALVARRFAEAGVGVAVGFEGEVMPEACQLLAVPVVKAALETNGARDEILKAFQAGCLKLQASERQPGEFGQSGPVAYYS